MEKQPTIEELKAIAKQLCCPEGEHGIKTGEVMNVNNIGMTYAAIDALSLQNQDHILEIGHGNAGHLAYLLGKANDIHYQGADISQTILKEARKINETFIAAGQARFELTDGETLPFPNEIFEKIFTVNTLYFWKNPVSYLKEIKRVLKPSGLFVLCFADKTFMEKLPFTPYGFQLYDLDNANDLLVQSGFTVINKATHTEEINSNAGFKVTRDYHTILVKG
jgi:ubiquinone/menaquinone biosynthesis C-methylase UbiE